MWQNRRNSGSDCTKGQAAKVVSDAHEEGANDRRTWHLQDADAADAEHNGKGTPMRNTLGTSISMIDHCRIQCSCVSIYIYNTCVISCVMHPSI